MSYRRLFWNWVERWPLRRNTPRLLPRIRGWKDFVDKAAVGVGAPFVPSGVAENLKRQLNSLTPWHVRIDVRVGPHGTATRAWSWLWAVSTSSVMVDSKEEDELERQLIAVLKHVQSFICRHTARAWPSAISLPESAGDPGAEDCAQRVREWDELLPSTEFSSEAGEAKLWWEYEGELVLALEPLPLASGDLA